MEINDAELDYLHFEKDSDGASNKSDEDLCYKKAYFISDSLTQFELLKVFQSEIFCTGKHIVYFQMSNFFLIETFVLNLCSFNTAENFNIVGTVF